MSGKKKKVTVTVKQKLEALFRIDRGDPLKSVAKDLGVGTSTVSEWRKNRKVIEDFCAKMVNRDSLSNRGTLKRAKNVTLDDALYVWYLKECEKGVPISGPILRKKALSLNERLGCDDTFTASVGWLGRWKARHGIKLTFYGENLLEEPSTEDNSVRLILEDEHCDRLILEDENSDRLALEDDDDVIVCLSSDDEKDNPGSLNLHSKVTNT